MSEGRDMAVTKAEVERALGFGLASLKRLKGGSTLNFKATRAADGLPFLAKVLMPEQKWVFDRLVRHFQDMAGTCAAHRLFPEAAGLGDGRLLFCMEWCEGAHLMPDQLAADELPRFLADYLEISRHLQTASMISAADPLLKWRETLMAMDSPRVRPLQRLVEANVPIEEITPQAELTKVIYGDFHHGNFVFRDGRLYRLFDLESFSYGYPTEDIVRYFVCAFEHLPLGGLGRRRSMLKAFAKAVDLLPYTRAEWMYAIDSMLLRKFEGLEEHELGFAKVLNLRLRAGFYLDLKIVASKSRQ